MDMRYDINHRIICGYKTNIYIIKINVNKII